MNYRFRLDKNGKLFMMMNDGDRYREIQVALMYHYNYESGQSSYSVFDIDGNEILSIEDLSQLDEGNKCILLTYAA